MFRKSFFLSILLLILASFACSVNVNLPGTQVKTGPLVTENISVPVPDASDIDVTLSLGAGELELNPGGEGGLMEGTVSYNVPDFKPEIISNNGNITIKQGELDIEGIPQFDEDVENHWDLKLSAAPMTLRIQAGAYVGKYDLGGLSIENLYVSDGAADVTLDFSSLNLVEMGILDYSTGASNVTLTHLANANFSTLVFKSGAGNYTLDFSGDLQRDANVKIDSGLSTVRILVPEGMNVKLVFDGGLTNVSAFGNWEETGSNTYTQSGEGSTLTITVDMGAGNLELSNP
ncbi:MAG TPA: toast rack family protein [Anaerolineales bacterium]|nr:toast rack family protein [Anaerolineales bacterium]